MIVSQMICMRDVITACFLNKCIHFLYSEVQNLINLIMLVQKPFSTKVNVQRSYLVWSPDCLLAEQSAQFSKSIVRV